MFGKYKFDRLRYVVNDSVSEYRRVIGYAGVCTSAVITTMFQVCKIMFQKKLPNFETV
ncbi:MAG: hypothetical protein ACI9XO_004866 [Paraglaciecola sp.]|jgi:hypothetical protein